ncbi:uncharacterized protein LOC18427036 [Amborella trichopoda]|uniref:NB-ARC domain-containing protein n=1 Tax=Amborella trichopoda TaxID=13333 RepID=W1NUK6_AMBTC|nr:uncharacterized protein LOC18427036 [Amborella trichopoda]ERM99003.1 hypothetical protein AMTR_s00101p00028030 [Amborella trichopoda]|eukprot:XP_006836150.1 uncharacterized protein LOC18427036 [Amborella trichopoda]
MANSTSEKAESDLWELLMDQETEKIKVKKNPEHGRTTIWKKLEIQNTVSLRTVVSIWVTVHHQKRIHGMIVEGSKFSEFEESSVDKSCLIYCRVSNHVRPLDLEDVMEHWTAQGLLESETKPPIEQTFKEITKFICTDSRLKEIEEANIAQRKVVNTIHSELYDMAAIPESFFDSRRELQVLSIWHPGISSIPLSLFKLKGLRVLSLHKSTGISALPPLIKELKNLQTLDLSCTTIKDLPKEMGELNSLKILILRDSLLKQIPIEISNLSLLSELDLFQSYIKWSNHSETNARLEDIARLERLRSLQIMVEDFECVSHEFIEKLKCLQRFHIVVCPSYSGWISKYLKEFSEKKYGKLMAFLCCDCKSMDGFSVLNDLDGLVISRCNNLSSVVAFIAAQKTLKFLRIEDGSGLKEMIGSGTERNPLESLENLCLVRLPLLKGELELGESLKFLRITECPLLTVLQNSLSKNKSLEEIHIGNTNGIEILESSLVRLEKVIIHNMPCLKRIETFSNLRVFQLWRCFELKDLLSGLLKAKRLEQLTICDLSGIEKLIDKGAMNEYIMHPNMVCLELLRLSDLTGVWEGELGVGELGNLRQLSVSDCPKVNSLLNAGFGRLKALEAIRITRCDGLEAIIGDEVRDADAIALKRLDLTELPNLRAIFSANTGMGFIEDLQVLCLKHCSKLKAILPSGFHGLSKLEHIYAGECQSLVKIIDGNVPANALPSFRKFLLENLPSLRAIWEGELGDGALRNLECLQVKNCPELDNLLPSSLHKLEKLEVIHIDNSDKMENIMGETTVGSFALPHLSYLFLSNIGKMNTIWRWGLGFEALGRLEQITVGKCPNLELLWNGEISTGALKSFKSLRLYKCPKIEVLLPSSLDRLERLQNISVEDCDKLEKIIEGSQMEKVGALQNMRSMDLRKLPRLRVLWEGELGFGALREMKSMTIRECPLLDSLPCGLNELPNLELLSIKDCESIDNIVGEVGYESPKFPNLVDLYLQDLANLKVIWHGEMGIGDFQWLECLILRGLNGLKHLPPGLNKLTKLKQLLVCRCGELQKFMGGELAEENSLPNLEHLDIADQPNMTTIWEDLGAGSLRKLKRLAIQNCPRLEALPLGLMKLESLEKLLIKECNSVVTVTPNEAVEGATLPNLVELRLEELPNLEKVWSGSTALPKLKYATITGCPKLKKFANFNIGLSLESLRGSKDWWEGLELEEDEKLKLQQCFSPWPMEGEVKRSPRFHRRLIRRSWQ